jgi:DNA-binding PadR family transcriptional regulator
LSTTDRLSPFSYAILVLVGRGGAGPHDLRRMSERGRVYWDAAPSQWYAEPKRLATLGYLNARKEPGRTRERTHYELTEKGRDAIGEWVGTPAPLPRIQNEPVVRLLAADLVDPAEVRAGLQALRAELAAAREGIEEGRAQLAGLPERGRLLAVNHDFAERFLELQSDWLDQAMRELER